MAADAESSGIGPIVEENDAHEYMHPVDKESLPKDINLGQTS